MNDFDCLSPKVCEEINRRTTKLWKYVIWYALSDALNELNFKLKKKAVVWFIENKDFQTICKLANCHAQRTRLFMLRTIAYHDKSVINAIFNWVKR